MIKSIINYLKPKTMARRKMKMCTISSLRVWSDRPFTSATPAWTGQDRLPFASRSYKTHLGKDESQVENP